MFSVARCSSWTGSSQSCHHILFILSTDLCDQPIYPPGFISNKTLPHCNVLIPQWTYNSTAGECMEFYYYACGEDRKGYNVFTSEQECMKTCVRKGDPKLIIMTACKCHWRCRSSSLCIIAQAGSHSNPSGTIILGRGYLPGWIAMHALTWLKCYKLYLSAIYLGASFRSM